MLWSALCLVVGSRFAGSPMMPNAGSYALMRMRAILSTPNRARSSPYPRSDGFCSTRFKIPWIAPADWCSYSPSLKCIPMTEKSDPLFERCRSNGLASAFSRFTGPSTFWSICPGPSKRRKIASGLRKMSRGPKNPSIVRCTHCIAASVEMAAELPLESLSCLPARIARNGMWCATTMPIAISICSAVAPMSVPYTAALAMAPCTTWSTL
mmetsp:Transcript_9795/g.22182  ORF Transcript_9795/g.22182 Transcript_9795/m.22182 type:complete len:210 (-) Transcript_9795:451-1080(-)